jgi:hypothetical protein
MSSGGGLTQLVAYGAQNVVLTGDTSHSNWKAKYPKHTNYALESIEQTLSERMSYGGSASVILSRSGDLVCGLVAEVTMTYNGAPDPMFPAEALFESIELTIGGQKVDQLYHNWFRVYAQMYFDATQKDAYDDAMNFTQEVAGQQRTFYFPIPFFFSQKNNRLALPLIALQYHEVEIKFNFCEQQDIQSVDTTQTPTVKIYADYVFLDSSERILYAQNPHEYLITQLQYQIRNIQYSPTSVLRYNIPLSFNHPTKMLTWVTVQQGKHGQFTALSGETNDNTAAPIASAVIQINGKDRFTERPGKYFKNANPWLYQKGKYLSSGIYTYNFGIDNTLKNPNSGTLNFSRIDNATLVLKTKMNNLPLPIVANTSTTEEQTYVATGNLTTVEIFALNYNVFRIMSGMGGLAYAS